MKWQDLIIEAYGRVLQALEKTLEGFSPDDLNQQPDSNCNSMGWLIWHLTRGQDSMIAGLAQKEQLWVSNGWYQKFNRSSDPKDTGFGHSPEDVAAFKSPDVETLLGYHREVLEQTKNYLTKLPETDLDREISGPFPTLGARLVAILSDNLQHAGQVAYLQGLLKGKR